MTIELPDNIMNGQYLHYSAEEELKTIRDLKVQLSKEIGIPLGCMRLIREDDGTTELVDEGILDEL